MAANYTGPGSATDPVDLVKKILTWLVAQGWTTDLSAADNTVGWRVHAHKGGVYVNLRAFINESGIWGEGMAGAAYGIALYTGSGFNGAVAWNAQAGGPIRNGQTYNVGVAMQLAAGAIVASHLFDDGADNITIVVERSSGVYGHLGWGAAAERGAGTARRFFFGSISGYYGGYALGIPGTTLTAYCPCSNNDGGGGAIGAYVKADVDAFTGKWLSVGAGVFTGSTGKYAPSSIPGNSIPSSIPSLAAIIARATSSINQQPNHLPLLIFADRDAGGETPLVVIPSIFFMNATTKGFAPASVYALGGTNYMIFPNFAVLKGS